jgi:hypothetical protein
MERENLEQIALAIEQVEVTKWVCPPSILSLVSTPQKEQA